MKGSLKAVAAAAAGLVIGGAIAAGAATTTDPVTLCIRNGAVRVASDDQCTGREARVEVASPSDVAALAARMDADDADDAATDAAVDALRAEVERLRALVEPDPDAGVLEVATAPAAGLEGVAFTLSVSGERLTPGSPVVVEFTNAGEPDSATLGVATADGSFAFASDDPTGCEITGLTAVGTSDHPTTGTEVRSATVPKGAGCP